MTFIKKCGIILLVYVMCNMAFSQTITIVNPDGSISFCDVNEQTGDIICW